MQSQRNDMFKNLDRVKKELDALELLNDSVGSALDEPISRLYEFSLDVLTRFKVYRCIEE